MLPSDPNFAKLTNSQIYWLNSNMEIDMQHENEAMRKAQGKDGFEYTTSDMTPEELAEQMKIIKQRQDKK